MEWGTLAVTKTVVGPAPASTTFSVLVSCEGTAVPISNGNVTPAELDFDFIADLGYGVSGGVNYVYTDHPVECTITEPMNGGATSTVITPPVVDMARADGLHRDGDERLRRGSSADVHRLTHNGKMALRLFLTDRQKRVPSPDGSHEPGPL